MSDVNSAPAEPIEDGLDLTQEPQPVEAHVFETNAAAKVPDAPESDDSQVAGDNDGPNS